MKSILLVSYEFPPTWTPQAKRWHSLLHAIGSVSSYKVEVLTTSLGPSYIPGQTQPGKPPELAPRFTVRRTSPGPLAERLYPHAASASSGAASGGIRKSVLKMILPVDKSIEWLISQFVALEKLLDFRSYDIVITSGPPHATHLWGYTIKRRYGVRWIADLGDPFTFACDNRAVTPVRCLQRILENAAFAAADAVVVTTDATRARYAGMYPLAAGHVTVIPQGVDVERYSALPWQPERGRLVYVGSFYRAVREPTELIAAIAQLDSTSLHVIGQPHGPALAQVESVPGLNRRVVFHGFHSEEYCLQQMCRAACLIFLSNGDSTQIPGKLYEYLATGIPILAILTGSERDPCIPLLQRWPQVRMVGNSCAEIAEALSQLPGPLPPNVATRALSWRNRAEDYLRLIERLTKTRPQERTCIEDVCV